MEALWQASKSTKRDHFSKLQKRLRQLGKMFINQASGYYNFIFGNSAGYLAVHSACIFPASVLIKLLWREFVLHFAPASYPLFSLLRFVALQF
ncbi:hypothetical protein E2C01_096956 [Portunus trituberculatus]|uniref:Uncharacterized protein n=1 Tax=Portunus trituberculatus TaxID=210409 RepID=A0A5B7K8N9_PORTR|nr:hypothetical protein [Portunus trituberculatus]